MIRKVHFGGLRPRSLLMLIFFLSYLLVVVSACSSEISTPAPTLEPEKSSPTGVVEETPKEALPADSIENGRPLFISKACSGCHTVQGIPEAQGKVGPELTHQVGNSLIADTLPNTDENLRKWLKDPSAVKPGTIMPNQNLTGSEIDALIAFLRTLK